MPASCSGCDRVIALSIYGVLVLERHRWLGYESDSHAYIASLTDSGDASQYVPSLDSAGKRLQWVWKDMCRWNGEMSSVGDL